MVAGMREAAMDWTAEAIEALRGFWAEGHSTAEIGRRMGISKNAVVGKAHRLNLPPRPSPIRRDGEGRLPSAPQPATLTPPSAASAMAAALPDAVAPGPEAPALEAPALEATAPEPRLADPVMAEPPAVDPMVTLPPLVQPATPQPAAAAPRPAEPAPQPAPQPVQVSAPPVAAPRPAVPPRRVVPPTAVVRPFQRSTGRSCCWPIGEPGTPDFRFCTAEAMSSKPYCAEHAAVAYVKARDRREDAA
jgi:GcrA cell cycle regulator